MLDVLLVRSIYTLSSIKTDILQQIKGFPSDSIIRFKMKNTENLYLLNVKLLDEIIPPTMNYQIAGFRDLKTK